MEKTKEHLLDQVYGITRDLPENYVTRDHIDDFLVANLTRDKHVVIHGSSKQGKTCLRKYWLQPEDHIVVQCNGKWDIRQLNTAILKAAEFKVVQSESKTVTGKTMVKASAGAKFMGIGASGEGGSEEAETTGVELVSLELDPEDANDIIRALKSINFNKFIVLRGFSLSAGRNAK